MGFESEESNILGGVAYCRGVDKRLIVPVTVGLSIEADTSLQVRCDNLGPNTICEASEFAEQCVLFRNIQPPTEVTPGSEIEVSNDAATVLFDRNTRKIMRSSLLEEGHDPVQVTYAESRILATLMENQGEIFTKTELYNTYREPNVPSYEGNAINVQITRIRAKLGDTEQEFITTLKKSGHMIPNPQKRNT